MDDVVKRLNGLASRDQARWHGLMWFVLAWAMQRRPPEEREGLISLAQAAQEDVLRRGEVRTMSRTIADELREEGLKEGLEEGALMAARAMLLSMIKHKFGRVPKAMRRRIETMADLVQLQSCTLRASEVRSLGDLEL